MSNKLIVSLIVSGSIFCPNSNHSVHSLSSSSTEAANGWEFVSNAPSGSIVYAQSSPTNTSFHIGDPALNVNVQERPIFAYEGERNDIISQIDPQSFVQLVDSAIEFNFGTQGKSSLDIYYELMPKNIFPHAENHLNGIKRIFGKTKELLKNLDFLLKQREKSMFELEQIFRHCVNQVLLGEMELASLLIMSLNITNLEKLFEVQDNIKAIDTLFAARADRLKSFFEELQDCYNFRKPELMYQKNFLATVSTLISNTRKWTDCLNKILQDSYTAFRAGAEANIKAIRAEKKVEEALAWNKKANWKLAFGLFSVVSSAGLAREGASYFFNYAKKSKDWAETSFNLTNAGRDFEAGIENGKALLDVAIAADNAAEKAFLLAEQARFMATFIGGCAGVAANEYFFSSAPNNRQ